MAVEEEDRTNPLVEQLLPVSEVEFDEDEPDWKHLRIVGGKSV